MEIRPESEWIMSEDECANFLGGSMLLKKTPEEIIRMAYKIGSQKERNYIFALLDTPHEGSLREESRHEVRGWLRRVLE